MTPSKQLIIPVPRLARWCGEYVTNQIAAVGSPRCCRCPANTHAHQSPLHHTKKAAPTPNIHKATTYTPTRYSSHSKGGGKQILIFNLPKLHLQPRKGGRADYTKLCAAKSRPFSESLPSHPFPSRPGQDGVSTTPLKFFLCHQKIIKLILYCFYFHGPNINYL